MKRQVSILALAVLCAGCLDPARTQPRSVAPTSRPEVRQPNVTPQVVSGSLLFAAAGGDGDSWKDTSGEEYRLGLINTPEYNECYGSEATAERQRLVASGFRAAVYTRDTYGRHVSVVTTANGTNVNVWLARHGFADDRYLDKFRHENPGLAGQLDQAFAEAKRERVGLWRACSGDAPQLQQHAPAPSPGGCDPAYPTVCIPPPPPDLDCRDISFRRFTVRAPDPHHFDADHDGIGCET